MTGRTVIVTGGTRGIGLALAEGFVLAGARVVVASRKADACAETEAYLYFLVGLRTGSHSRYWVMKAVACNTDPCYTLG